MYELRQMEFQQTPNKMLQLFRYQRVFREIWRGCRTLPDEFPRRPCSNDARDGGD
jgi:hypothetical protein